MEGVPGEDAEGLIFIVPHHCVFKDSGTTTTTKLRVVSDGSCESSCVSHNSISVPGPVVQPDLISVAPGFCSCTIAVSADIVEIYRCVGVHPSDRNPQGIVWRNTAKACAKDYRLTSAFSKNILLQQTQFCIVFILISSVEDTPLRKLRNYRRM
jgi:hypothetical protein